MIRPEHAPQHTKLTQHAAITIKCNRLFNQPGPQRDQLIGAAWQALRDGQDAGVLPRVEMAPPRHEGRDYVLTLRLQKRVDRRFPAQQEKWEATLTRAQQAVETLLKGIQRSEKPLPQHEYVSIDPQRSGIREETPKGDEIPCLRFRLVVAQPEAIQARLEQRKDRPLPLRLQKHIVRGRVEKMLSFTADALRQDRAAGWRVMTAHDGRSLEVWKPVSSEDATRDGFEQARAQLEGMLERSNQQFAQEDLARKHGR
jgi:hypothetical protein